ncbi:TetR/AcrR family transcriptional regulator [Gracilibacillus alcaliphilus]|uniref:TetR/AcrR family transcriptional regulator n=1 Tax=Gracilibacillus alcaliphilus TaxID=1401441 RepID=UPI00195C7F7C|nr:TetR/AcrR family transcriptional regulator [Gracilibacillus alcaliphilus]MBM7678827.1 AcrR family transcriptional regulator [Gracilibacillus alcaliphilus]
MADRRIKKTKKAIKQAFLTLLQENELTKITVSQICSMADIGRGTFYLHYQDIFDLYEKLEGELLNQLLEWIDELYGKEEPITLAAFMEKTAEFIIQNKAAFEIFMNEKKNNALSSKIKEIIVLKELGDRKRNGQFQDSIFEEYQVSFHVSGTIEVLNKWIETGMIQSPKEISEIISRIITATDH